uniref:Uncharacterized protein n=1 Tax=Fundulus heteroclitus TaxID=8078 RepID=A0A146RDQ8_FUNHE
MCQFSVPFWIKPLMFPIMHAHIWRYSVAQMESAGFACKRSWDRFPVWKTWSFVL